MAAGYYGWYREDKERSSDLVSLALLFGSLAVVVPLFVATLVHRFGLEISHVDELGLVFGSVALLGSGILCRVRSTTIVGDGPTRLRPGGRGVHAPLPRTADPRRHLPHHGGGLLFGTGLVLSIYRDRLLPLPDKIKRREGVFRVFGWR